MAPLVPSCQECDAPATPENPMSKCLRCQVVFYCSREHQQKNYSAHKTLCRRAKECYDLIAREEAKLQSLPPDESLPENVFEQGVGTFWLILPTREYMRAKYDVIRTMSVMNSHTAMERGLAECMDSLRLCRGDNIGIREVVPALLLALGRFQEAYDFIKWYATADPDGTFEWGNPESPFLTVKNADMTESISYFKKESSCFFLAALAYIKLTLAIETAMASAAFEVAILKRLPEHVAMTISGFLDPTGHGTRSQTDLRNLQLKLFQQAQEAFKLVHKRNVNFWKYMLDPMPLLQEPDPGYYAPGDRFEVKIWLMPNAYLWMPLWDYVHENLESVTASN